MSTRRADFLLGSINKRIEELDTDKPERLKNREQREKDELTQNKIERNNQLFMRMNRTREERQDKEKLRQSVRYRQLSRMRSEREQRHR